MSSSLLPEHPALDRVGYEIVLRGVLGPVLLSAFPEMRAARLEVSTVLSARVPDDRDILRIVGLLTAHGAEVECVRRAGQVHSTDG